MVWRQIGSVHTGLLHCLHSSEHICSLFMHLLFPSWPVMACMLVFALASPAVPTLFSKADMSILLLLSNKIKIEEQEAPRHSNLLKTLEMF